MSDEGKVWDMRRIQQLRSSMSDADVSTLKSKGQSNPASLTLDEVGVLFLIARERIREIEADARSKGHENE